MTKQLTKAQLTVEVDNLTVQLRQATTARLGQADALTALEAAMARQAEALEAAQARATEAEAQATAAAEAHAAAVAQAVAETQARATAAAAVVAAAQAQAQADAAPQPEELIPKPDGARFNINNAMQLSRQDFLTIRATIHNLVKSAQLNWREDFRNQDPTQLGYLFKAARKEHPVLKRYVNNWATAAIARTYMQNMRKYARKQGYIPAWQPGKNTRGSTSGNGGNGSSVGRRN